MVIHIYKYSVSAKHPLHTPSLSQTHIHSLSTPTRPPLFCQTTSAFLVSMARPRVRNPRRASLVGSLLERDGQQGLVTARWRHSTHRPAAGVRGSQQRTPLNLPTHDAAPLSTLDRHGSAFRYVAPGQASLASPHLCRLKSPVQ